LIGKGKAAGAKQVAAYLRSIGTDRFKVEIAGRQIFVKPVQE
jgi:hypothetical protein